jgi:sugar phosphate isomerase/epimerase
MLLSTQTDYFARTYGDKKAIQMISEAGFDAIDYSMFELTNEHHPLNGADYAEYALSLRKTAEECGVIFNQAHAPFPSYREGDPKYNSGMFSLIARSIEIAGILGAKTIIVHPFSLSDANAIKELNLDFFSRLEPYCRQYNVKVALENMWNWDEPNKRILPGVCSSAKEFAGYVDALDFRYFTACLDLGHCSLVGENAADMIRELGSQRLTALHVHDNDAKQDLHTLPFFGKLDWYGIAEALADIGYSGELTLEADNFLHAFPRELLPYAARFMHDTGRWITDMIERYKEAGSGAGK